MKVLYAIDGSAPSTQAGELLVKLADPDRVEITVLSIPPSLTSDAQDPTELRERLTEATSDLIDRTADSLGAQGFQVARHVSQGRPGEEIVRLVRNDWFDLTVMGAANSSWLNDTFLGSTSTYVLHSSPSSVLIVRDSPSAVSPAPVLMATDGSPGAALAIETLGSFLRPDACHVTAFSVATDPGPAIDIWPLPRGDVMTDAEIDAKKKARFEEAEAVARAAAEALDGEGLKASFKGCIGNPAVEIINEATSGAYDMVALGSRGLGPVRRVLLGSVSDQVARHARATLVARRIV